jgi:hypothetical protein
MHLGFGTPLSNTVTGPTVVSFVSFVVKKHLCVKKRGSERSKRRTDILTQFCLTQKVSARLRGSSAVGLKRKNISVSGTDS